MAKIACIFPGYGSQFVGMGKELYDKSRTIQEYFEQACRSLDINFIKLCFASSEAELGQIVHAYLANFLISSSLYSYLKEQGFKPDVVVGYNQGEYAALYASKAFNFFDGFYLLTKYATIYQTFLTHHTFLLTQSSGVSRAKIAALCKKISKNEGQIGIAISLSETVHIVAGHQEAINAFCRIILTQYHGSIDEQPLEIGLHSADMDTVVDQFAMYLEKVDFKDPSLEFMSGIEGKTISKGAQIKKHMLNTINKPVRWDKVVLNLKEYDIIVQIGPGNNCLKEISAQFPEKICIAINKESDVKELLAIINSGQEQKKGHTDDPESIS